MPHGIETRLIETVTPMVRELVTTQARALADLHYADVRLEVSEGKFAGAENGEAKTSGDDYAFALGIRVLAGRRMIAPGYFGRGLGAADVPHLARLLREGLLAAYRRAMANAEMKAEVKGKFGSLGDALADTRLHPIAVRQEVVPAVFEVDPRDVALDDMQRLTTDVSRRVAGFHASASYNYVSTMTQLSRELFASSEGAVIDQSFALTQGMCYVVATGRRQQPGDLRRARPPARLGDPHPGRLRAADRVPALPGVRPRDGPRRGGAGRRARAPAPAGEVPVVTDPHYNTLLSHEIVGHPVELDRGLKMETAYAGRSWLLRGLDDTQLGKRIASPLVNAFSDPSLPGYGHYAYDHEGTPARRVVHIDRGVFTGFMNSRQTAAVFGGDPNGHWKATDASLVPLVRMSSTVFAGGDRDPADLIKEIDHGYLLVGHRTPSIAESRENFRITARKIYEIDRGQVGRLYRDGGIMADSRDFLMHVDGVGRDFRLYPIPNCGKGQPMQTRKLGNGGPTLRSRAIVTGGA